MKRFRHCWVYYRILNSECVYRTAARLVLPHSDLDRKLVYSYCDVPFYRHNATKFWYVNPFFIRESDGGIASAIT